MGMGHQSQPDGNSHGPSLAVLLLCALVLAGGYGVALLRGLKSGQEVRVVIMAPPEPAPGLVTEPK